jgi:hypothetical protein
VRVGRCALLTGIQRRFRFRTQKLSRGGDPGRIRTACGFVVEFALALLLRVFGNFDESAQRPIDRVGIRAHRRRRRRVVALSADYRRNSRVAKTDPRQYLKKNAKRRKDAGAADLRYSDGITYRAVFTIDEAAHAVEPLAIDPDDKAYQIARNRIQVERELSEQNPAAVKIIVLILRGLANIGCPGLGEIARSRSEPQPDVAREPSIARTR